MGRLRNWGIVGVLTAVLGFLVFQAITSASVYFYHVDEALEKREELGDRTFRIHGVVVSEPTTDASGALVFTIGYNDATTSVRHIGEEPTDLFELSIPVVAEGRWVDEGFQSSRLLIKHTESYVADHPDHIDPEIEARLSGTEP